MAKASQSSTDLAVSTAILSPVNTRSIHDFFELLGLPAACAVDETQLEANYRQLQAKLHPDRFVNADAPQRLAALQQSSILNDAYATLKSPLRRAEHLLSLQGVDVHEHVQAHLDGAFLLAQMEVREELEAMLARQDLQGLEGLQVKARKELSAIWQDFAGKMEARQFPEAKPAFHKLQFLYKLIDEIIAAEDRLLD